MCIRDRQEPVSCGTSGSETITVTEEGIHRLSIMAADRSGNESVFEMEVKKDSGLPLIEAELTAAGLQDDYVMARVGAEYSGPSGLESVLMRIDSREWQDAVSYTHLDVYKRQVEGIQPFWDRRTVL